jgi:SecD/SecF fusion protein
MNLPSRTTGLVALVLVLTIAGGFAWNSYLARQPDFDDVGGTVLVFQIDRRAKEAADVGNKVMADVLQRRFSVDGLRHVTVRPGEADQVEVRVLRVGDHDADLQSIKEMVARVGRLEFRILANSNDDDEGIEAAQHMLNEERVGDAKLDREIRDAQNNGLPPPGPRDLDGDPRKFHLRLARGLTSTVSYSWVGLSAIELRLLNLDNAAKDELHRDLAWKDAFAHRGQAVKLREAIPHAAEQRSLLLQGALFYSRVCEDRNLPEKDRREMQVDYFVLARDPEFDPATGKRTPDIDGSCLASVHADRDANGRPMVGFALNPEGADLIGTLTRKNGTEDGVVGAHRKMRHLAIVLDGQVMSAPTINSEIRDRGSITGSFTKREIDDLVSILRTGALPGRLLPRPVREVTVEPKRGG